MDNKPKTIQNAFERIERMRALVEQAQTALDTEIYALKELAGSTFEYEGSRFQVRTPNGDKKDRKHTAVQHPFIVELKTTPREAKAAARIRKSGLTPDEVQANLDTLVALEGTESNPVEVTTLRLVTSYEEAALVKNDPDETTSDNEETVSMDGVLDSTEDSGDDDIVIV